MQNTSLKLSLWEKLFLGNWRNGAEFPVKQRLRDCLPLCRASFLIMPLVITLAISFSHTSFKNFIFLLGFCTIVAYLILLSCMKFDSHTCTLKARENVVPNCVKACRKTAYGGNIIIFIYKLQEIVVHHSYDFFTEAFWKLFWGI